MIFKNERGSVAVVTAVSLFVLVGVLAFTLDTAYLYVEKNRYQNAVEAAALAGVSNLCAGDQEEIEAIVRSVAEENGLSEESGSLTVTFGFYDEKNRYTDFPVYKDFVDEDGMPAGEYVNAVSVAYLNQNATLTGLNEVGKVAAAAVAFLRRLDMVSIGGDIFLGHNSEWENCTFFSNGDIKYPASASMSGKSYAPPAFANCSLLTAGQMLQCPVKITTTWQGSKMTIQWDAGSPHSIAGAKTGLDPLTEIRPVDESYMETWRQKADTIYTPADAGKDDVFYSTSSYQYLGKYHYNVDLGGLAGSQRRVIFFDAGTPPPADFRVLIGPKPSSTDMGHTPNGFSVSNLTFVATCPILIVHTQANVYPELTLGSQGQDQAIIISAQDITVHTGGVIPNGVVFRTGTDFSLWGSREVQLRVIADGNITGGDTGDLSAYSVTYKGMLPQPCDCRFGPPCPPVLPKLGAMEAPGD